MITVNDIHKRYGSFDAVSGVSIVVPSGEIHGFLGPNGAGKTTTIRMIAGLLKPTAGSISRRMASLMRSEILKRRSRSRKNSPE